MSGRSVILHRFETKYLLFGKGLKDHRTTVIKEFDWFDVFLGDEESSDGRELHLISQLSGARGQHDVPFSSYLRKESN